MGIVRRLDVHIAVACIQHLSCLYAELCNQAVHQRRVRLCRCAQHMAGHCIEYAGEVMGCYLLRECVLFVRYHAHPQPGGLQRMQHGQDAGVRGGGVLLVRFIIAKKNREGRLLCGGAAASLRQHALDKFWDAVSHHIAVGVHRVRGKAQHFQRVVSGVRKICQGV